jgi:hypothetical protein
LAAGLVAGALFLICVALPNLTFNHLVPATTPILESLSANRVAFLMTLAIAFAAIITIIIFFGFLTLLSKAHRN